MSHPTPTPPKGLRGLLAIVGPGLVVAATGVGAGDMVAAGKAGASFGLVVLWAALWGTVLKFVLAEGVARYQLATGETILEGWVAAFGKPLHAFFSVYLVMWSFIVAAALMSGCGLAAHALVPALSVKVWGILHSLVALLVVWVGRYSFFENTMKIAVAVMFLAIVGSAAIQQPDLRTTLTGLVHPHVPTGGTVLLLGVMGGVGGTLTLLSYNYWLAEKGWRGPEWMQGVRFDLGVGYALTGVFGLGLMILAGVVLHPQGIEIAGSKGILELAAILGDKFGRAGEIVFLVGFWGAVATSTLGVWQGVPYLFENYVQLLRREKPAHKASSKTYRGYLLFLALPPMLLLFMDRPVWLVVAYAAVGSLFMPFLAATLLVLNNRENMGVLKNGWLANGFLVLSLGLFLYLMVNQLKEKVF